MQGQKQQQQKQQQDNSDSFFEDIYFNKELMEMSEKNQPLAKESDKTLFLILPNAYFDTDEIVNIDDKVFKSLAQRIKNGEHIDKYDCIRILDYFIFYRIMMHYSGHNEKDRFEPPTQKKFNKFVQYPKETFRKHTCSVDCLDKKIDALQKSQYDHIILCGHGYRNQKEVIGSLTHEEVEKIINLLIETEIIDKSKFQTIEVASCNSLFSEQNNRSAGNIIANTLDKNNVVNKLITGASGDLSAISGKVHNKGNVDLDARIYCHIDEKGNREFSKLITDKGDTLFLSADTLKELKKKSIIIGCEKEDFHSKKLTENFKESSEYPSQSHNNVILEANEMSSGDCSCNLFFNNGNKI